MMLDHPPPRLAQAYRAEMRDRCRHAARTAAQLGMVLVPCFGLLDALAFPEQVARFLAMRAGCVAGIAALRWTLGRPLGARRPELVALGVAILIVATIDVMIAQTGGAASRYWAGLPLVLLGVTVLMPWRAMWPIAASVLVVGTYLLTVCAAGTPIVAIDLTSNLCFLAVTGVIATVGAVRANRLQWREFVQRAALEDALRHKSDFMAKMSHELRTPLHAIVGYADILLDDPRHDDATRPLVERIRSRGVFLHRLITDLLDYAKVEAGKMDVRSGPVPLGELVAQTVASFRPLTARKGLALDLRIEPGLSPIVSDAHRIEQVVSNLLANALKFTAQGRITVEVRLVDGALEGFTRLGTPLPPAGPTVGLLVTDTGVGIHERDFATLAQDFQQLGEAGDHFGGTGLGLSIARRLVELLGGSLLLTSRRGAGSTFAVLLPAPTPRYVARHAA